jgi:hypothetical protein
MHKFVRLLSQHVCNTNVTSRHCVAAVQVRVDICAMEKKAKSKPMQDLLRIELLIVLCVITERWFV